jgi:hypothetical protein
MSNNVSRETIYQKSFLITYRNENAVINQVQISAPSMREAEKMFKDMFGNFHIINNREIK